jgi:hypothetical protein
MIRLMPPHRRSPPQLPARRRWPIVWLAGGLAGWLAGCALFSSTTPIRVQLPEPPAHWQRAFGGQSWLLTWPDEEGRITRLRVAQGEPPPVIPCPRGACTPVLAYPLHPDGAALLPPAGGLDPWDRCEAGRLELSWKQGVVGLLLFRLARQGGRIEAINVPRLRREIGEQGGSDPWRLDLDGMLARLSGGSFRSDWIRLKDSREVSLPLEPGTWFLESPFSPPVPSDGVHPLRFTGLTLGLHHLFERDSGRRVDLFLDEKEWLWMTAAARKPGTGPALRFSPEAR